MDHFSCIIFIYVKNKLYWVYVDKNKLILNIVFYIINLPTPHILRTLTSEHFCPIWILAGIC